MLLLIISGSIAAYKILEVIRRLRHNNITISVVMTKESAKFVTPLSIAALTENIVYNDVLSLTEESKMGHIRLSREADLILVAPASADILAKMATGQANDLATASLLASDRPVMIAPAMNIEMWNHPATQNNINILERRGILRIGPSVGNLACGEFGLGRLAGTGQIITSVLDFFKKKSVHKILMKKKVVITSGPTHEPIDPVRYISNKSSGKQGYAIASELSYTGANVNLISGPVNLAHPPGVNVIEVKTGRDMLFEVIKALPADIVICVAAVTDWYLEDVFTHKIKKHDSKKITFLENPDILATVSQHTVNRPQLVIGFSAETENIIENARYKRVHKQCDWVLANNVDISSSTFGSHENEVIFISSNDPSKDEFWKRQHKNSIAYKLIEKISNYFLDK